MYQIGNVTDLLGGARGRYFSNGFKGFNFHYGNLCFRHQQLSADASITWDSEWIVDNRHLHIGSIEYLAMGCFICEHMLIYLCHLSEYQVTDAQIRYCKMKVRNVVTLQQGTKINIQGKLINTTIMDLSASKLLSGFEIAIGHVVLNLEVMHPVPYTKRKGAAFPVAPNLPRMFNHGYKQRTFDIYEIACDVEEMACSATVMREEPVITIGFGTLHHNILPTDMISISGQLTQILMCKLESKQKEELNNIWLRELDIIFITPKSNNRKNKIALYFKKFEQFKVKKEWWRAVNLEVDFSEAKAKFKIAYKLNCLKD